MMIGSTQALLKFTYLLFICFNCKVSKVIRSSFLYLQTFYTLLFI